MSVPIPFHSCGQVGIIKDIAPAELVPPAWSDGLNIIFRNGKVTRRNGHDFVLGTPLGPPVWLMFAFDATNAFWMYAENNTGNDGVNNNDSFTKILLHMDGADASTTFTDSNAGGAAHVWTAAGNAQIDTAQSKFNGASGLFDGTGDWVTTPDHVDYTLGAGDWTAECWFRTNSAGGTAIRFFGQGDAIETISTVSLNARLTAGNVIQVFAAVGGTPFVVTGTTQFTSAINPGWHHMAFVRTGNILKLFVDGVQEGGNVAIAGTVNDSANAFRVAASGEVTSVPWNGWIDEFRLSVGVARYTADFTPALLPFDTTNTRVFATDGANHADITRLSGVYTYQPNQPFWDGVISSGIPIITNGIDKPQAWTPVGLSTRLVDLPNWPANVSAKIIRVYKSFVIALNIVKSGVTYPHLIKWSHPAAPGAVPSTWDETDPTKLAGERELADEFAGEILDAAPLRDALMIYKTNSVWGLQHIGGTQIFRSYPILTDIGILASHCVARVREGRAHLFASADDLIVFDGQNTESVLDARAKKYLEDTIEPGATGTARVVAVPKTKEAWFIYATIGNDRPNLALIWNWQENTIAFRSLPTNITAVAMGALTGAGISGIWDQDPLTWDSDSSIWDAVNFRANFFELVASDDVGNRFYGMDRTQFFGDGVTPYSAFVERRDLAVTGRDRITGAYKADPTVRKLVNRIWIKASGAPFRVLMGGRETVEDGLAITWSAFQTFTPGLTKYLDFEINSPLIALYFESSVDGAWVIESFDLELVPLGQL